MSSKTIAEQLAKKIPAYSTIHVVLVTPEGVKLPFTYHNITVEKWAAIVRGLEDATKDQR